MRYRLVAVLVLISGLGLAGPSNAWGQTAEDAIVDAANSVLRETMTLPAERIPQNLLREAMGIAIIPNMLKGGFVIGVRHGRGIMTVRGNDGAWQPPSFVTMTGGSVGWQAGLQSTDVILVFRTRKSIDSLLQNKLTLGVDAAVAAGPAGRQAAAATDLMLRAEILSYSRSRGLFAGVSFDGSSLQVDPGAGSAYYSGAAASGGSIPASAARLLFSLNEYSKPTESVAGPPGAVPQPVPVAQMVPVNPLAAPAADQARQQLADAGRRLSELLDEQWRQYLALPRDIYVPERTATYQTLVDALGRYDSVAADPRYAVLARRPEFAAAHALLREYTKLMSTSAGPAIALPPPPGGANTVPVPGFGTPVP